MPILSSLLLVIITLLAQKETLENVQTSDVCRWDDVFLKDLNIINQMVGGIQNTQLVS